MGNGWRPGFWGLFPARYCGGCSSRRAVSFPRCECSGIRPFLSCQISWRPLYCPGSIQLKPFARIKAEDFAQDFQLQVIGAIRVIQQVLPILKASPQASIVLFSTVAVQTGFTFHTQVATSKGAIEGLTKALAAELAPKIRVNCIAPSITDTPLAGTLLSTPEKKEANAQRHPLKKIGAPEDIAETLPHFC